MRYLVRFDFGLYYAFGKAIEVLSEKEMKMINDFSESGKEVNLGEIEGKHSEAYGPLEKSDYRVISTDEAEIETFIKLVGYNFGAFYMSEAVSTTLEEEEE